MRSHTPLVAHLFPRSAHPAATRGHTLGAPGFYELTAELMFFGRRRAAFDQLVRASGVQPGARALDVACGTGYLARLMAQAVGPAGLTVGIDASTEMIEYAERKSAPLGNCRFHVGTAESLAFPADHFDVVTCSLAMHHLPDDVQPVALREMLRVLRPGGSLLVADAKVPAHGLAHVVSMVTGHSHMARVTPNLANLIAHAGFADISTGEVPPWLGFVRAVKPELSV